MAETKNKQGDGRKALSALARIHSVCACAVWITLDTIWFHNLLSVKQIGNIQRANTSPAAPPEKSHYRPWA